MSLYFQVALPLLLTSIALLAIMIIRRYFKAGAIVPCLVALAIAVWTGYSGISNNGLFLGYQFGIRDSDTEKYKELPLKAFDQTSNNLITAEQYIIDGNFEEAKNIIASIKAANGTAPDVTLASARLSLLSQNYDDAVLLYEKANAIFEQSGKAFPGEEYSYATALYRCNTYNDAAIITYLSNNGYAAEDYGLNTAAAVDNASYSDIAANIIKQLSNDIETRASTLSDSESISRSAKIASELTALFNGYLSGDEFNPEEVSKNIRKLSKAMESGKSLMQNKNLRLARLKGYVLLEEYDEIANTVDEYSCPEELMIVAELHINGLVKNSDFSDAYISLDSDEYTRIIDQCDTIVDTALFNERKAVRREYREKIDSIKTLKKHPALSTLKEDLLDKIEGTNSTLTSKGYLELAKVENYLGNPEQADEYITDAFGTVSYSDDTSYVEPMNTLVGIIEGTGDNSTEKIKDVASYVTEAVDNSLPLSISSLSLASNTDQDKAEDKTDAAADFSEYMTSEVSEKTAIINIGAINKDDFPTISSRFQINSNKITGISDIKQYLEVFDCGSSIGDYSVSELEYQTSRIILLCDVSGSMSGNVSSLKNAITQFSDEMNENEEICVVGFDNRIEFVSEFTSDANEVISFAGKIGAYGGTDMFSALLYAGNLFPDDINANNIIILLTDGQDNNPASESAMHDKITAMAADKSATVYTLGLGSEVDTTYLTQIADAGNGSFLYVDTETSLENFYDFIHQQLTNQYILTYTAKNTSLNKRKLELSITEELGSASKLYYLSSAGYADEASDSYDAYVVTDADITLSGFAAKFLYKSSSDQTIMLRGTGFDSGDEITVKISDNVGYTLTAAYIDETTYEVLIPSNVATGTYDLEVSIRGEHFSFDNELTIAVQGTEKSFRYGSYVFTALKSKRDDSGNTVLSGNVVMNGWLYFKGEVTIEGDYLDSGKVLVTDNSGAYVSYSENNSTGLANHMAKLGVPVSLGALGSFYIYADDYNAGDYKNFPVESIDVLSECNLLFLIVENFSLTVYPDMVQFNGLNVQCELPFQKQLLRNFPDMRSYSYDFDTGMLINATKIGFISDISCKDFAKTDFTMVAVPLKLSKLDVGINTLTNDYSLEGDVKFKALKNMDSISFTFKIKEGKFDTIGLSVGGNYKTTIVATPVPITMGDFGFELSGFSKYETSNTTLANILSTTISFTFEVNAADASKYLPKITKLIGDDDDTVALATLKDAKLSATLKTFTFKFEADMVFLTVLDIGHCEIEAGSFKYTNALIGFNNTTEYGLRTAVTLGSEWETTNLSLELKGSAEITLGVPYTGLWLNGVCDFDIGWWIMKADFNVSGDILLGVFNNSSNNLQLSIIVRGTNTKGKYSGFHLYITQATGLDIYTY